MQFKFGTIGVLRLHTKNLFQKYARLHMNIMFPCLSTTTGNGLSNFLYRQFFVGVTCGNDWSQIDKAINHHVDYVSFCSMFPSATSNSCELINIDVVRRLCNTTNIPVYVSGGITVDNLAGLLPLGIKGVAIASGIMKANDVEQVTIQFKQAMSNFFVEHN
jgi:thiamine monophosphate synthase